MDFLKPKKLSYLLCVFSLQLVHSTEEKPITIEHVKTQLKQYVSSNANIDEIISEDSEYNFGSQLAEEFVSKIGTNKFPQVRVLFPPF